MKLPKWLRCLFCAIFGHTPPQDRRYPWNLSICVMCRKTLKKTAEGKWKRQG